MNDLEAKIYGNALNLIPELGPIRLLKLSKLFGGYRRAWETTAVSYQQAGISQALCDRIEMHKKLIDPESSLKALDKTGIEILLLEEQQYPALLKEIANPPPLLYSRGNKQIINNYLLALVGSRKMTSYGREVINRLVPDLTTLSINLVSGLAFGCDAEALSAALRSGGKPIAVLATSLDNASISPRANFRLAMEIAKSGCLVSEYPLNTTVQKQNFPIRNRIISGLSHGTLVIEADEESGALITANYAVEQNREVFAVPGSIYSPMSRGTNNLIKKGAKLISNAFDIVEELNLDVAQKLVEAPELSEVSKEEEIILQLLSVEPLHLDDIIRKSRFQAKEINSIITMLEMKGRIRNLGRSKYAKIR